MAMIRTDAVCHMAIVVEDIEKTLDNWCKLFGMEKPSIGTVPPSSQVPAYTDGELGDYSDCRIAVIRFTNLLLEFVQPGAGPSPWRDLLEKNGGNCLQNISFVVPDSKEAFRAITEVGGPLPFHIGFYPGGTYTFIDTTEQLGIPINIKEDCDNTALIDYLHTHPGRRLSDKDLLEGVEQI
jgi:hypothetical protein